MHEDASDSDANSSFLDGHLDQTTILTIILADAFDTEHLKDKF